MSASFREKKAVKNIHSLILIMGVSAKLSAQVPAVLFEKTYAPTHLCGTRGLVETNDHGFLMAGWESPGNGNAFVSVIRTDSAGNEVWSRSYGKPWDESVVFQAEAWDIARSPGGSYVIAGESEFEGVRVDGRELPYYNGYIFKIDDKGDLIWEKSYRLEGDTDYRHFCAVRAIDALPGVGYVAAGYHDVGSSDEDPPRWDGYLVVIDENGEKIREVVYEPGDKPSLEWFNDVKATYDGGFVASGFYSDVITTEYISHGLVVKFNKEGVEEWHYVYNSSNRSAFWGIMETSDRNFVVVGSELTSPIESNSLVFKLSANGEVLDSLLLHNYDHNCVLDVVEAHDGYLAAGYVYNNFKGPYYSQAYLLKLDSKVDFKWELLVGRSQWGEAWAMARASGGGCALAGEQIQFHDTTAYHSHYLAMTGGEPPTAVDVSQAIPGSFHLFQNFPNPFNPSTIIHYQLPQRARVSLVVFNTLGQQVAEIVNGEQEADDYEVRFDGSSLPSGVYFYQLHAGSFSETKKLVLLR
jgi:hypothetical protein